jgi:hypothetical protein
MIADIDKEKKTKENLIDQSNTFLKNVRSLIIIITLRLMKQIPERLIN